MLHPLRWLCAITGVSGIPDTGITLIVQNMAVTIIAGAITIPRTRHTPLECGMAVWGRDSTLMISGTAGTGTPQP